MSQSVFRKDQADDYRLDTDTVAVALSVAVTGIPPPPEPTEPARAIETSVHAPKLCARGLALQNIKKEKARFERNHALDGREMTHLKKRKADYDAETAKHEESIAKSQKLKAVSEKNSQAFQEKIEVLDQKKEKNYEKGMESFKEQQEKAESSLRRMQVRAHAELGEQLKGTRYEEGIPDSDESDSPPSEAWQVTIDSPTVFDVDDSDDELPPPKKTARFASRPKPEVPRPNLMRAADYTVVSKKKVGLVRSNPKVGPKK